MAMSITRLGILTLAFVVYVGYAMMSYIRCLKWGSTWHSGTGNIHSYTWHRTYGALDDANIKDVLPPNALACHDKYSRRSVQHMHKRFQAASQARGTPPRVFIAAALSNCAGTLRTYMNALTPFIALLGARNVFVSVVESGSGDATRPILRAFSNDLTENGVQHVVSVDSDPVVPRFVIGKPHTGNRITYLAKLRNVVLDPLYRLGAEMTKHYAKVLYLNDILLCEGDLWRILSLDADLTCGFDFEHNHFRDTWVYAGQKLSDVCSHFEEPRYNECDMMVPLDVKCCWNGMAAIRTAVFAAGIRFRWGITDRNGTECANSECSLLCRDMQRIGFDRILADPTVQVGYEPSGLYARRRTSPEALFDDRASFVPRPESEKLEIWDCCPLEEPGAYHPTGECFVQDLSPLWGTPLPYRAAQYEYPFSPRAPNHG